MLHPGNNHKVALILLMQQPILFLVNCLFLKFSQRNPLSIHASRTTKHSSSNWLTTSVATLL